MREITKKIVIIDDDACNNHVFKIVLRHLCRPVMPDVMDFTSSQEGVSFVKEWVLGGKEPLILFLDINMPSQLSGWDVLDSLSTLPKHLWSSLTVYMFSSSIDITDEQRANAHPLVERFVRKPLNPTMSWLKEILVETDSPLNRLM